jgi:hypothetical protein
LRCATATAAGCARRFIYPDHVAKLWVVIERRSGFGRGERGRAGGDEASDGAGDVGVDRFAGE